MCQNREVHHNKCENHDHRTNGQQFAQNHDFLNRLPVINVRRDNKHDGGGGHTHKKRVVADVETPRYAIVQVRSGLSGQQLLLVLISAGADEDQQEEAPSVIKFIALQD